MAGPQTHAAYGNMVSRQPMLARYHEDAIWPDLPIIDPHHHLWPENPFRYLLPELSKDLASGHNFKGTLYMQSGRTAYYADGPEAMRPVGETHFATKIAEEAEKAGSKACCVLVAYADLALGKAVEEVLQAHISAAKGRLRGIRRHANWDASGVGAGVVPTWEHVLLDAKFREGFGLLEPLGLTFDSWQFHPQLGDVADLARAFPGTSIIVNHTGGVLGVGPYAGHADEVFAVWKAGIEQLAQCPNVTMKLGGLGMVLNGFPCATSEAPMSSAEIGASWKPYFEICIEAFGAERCMFESNYPADCGTGTYSILWNAFKHTVKGASESELSALFFGTANRLYRMGL